MGEYYGVRRTGDEPYIEHLGVPKGWTKQGHKYLARLVSSTGKGYRYIYSQAELAAAKAGKLGNKAGKAANSAYKTVRKNVNNAVTGAKKSLGVYARRDMNRKWDALGTTRNPYSKAKSNKLERFMAARRAYEKTPLGRVESFKNRTIENAQQAYYGAEKKAKRLAKAVGDAASEAGRQANKTYKAARKGVMNAAGDAQKYVNKQVGRAQKAYKDYQNFKKLPDWQKKIAVNADQKGVKKVMGRNVRGAATASRLEGIENAIRRTTGSARKGVMNAGKQISRTANDTLDNVQRTANDAYRGARKTVRDTDRNVRSQTKRAIRSTSVGRDIDDRVGLTKQGRHNRRNERYKQEVLANREYNRHNPNFSKKRKAQVKRKKGISGSTHSSNSF